MPVSEKNEDNKSSSSDNFSEDEQMPVPVFEENGSIKSSSSKKQADDEEIESNSSDSSSEIRNQEPHASLAQQLQSENSADERSRTPVEKILKSASEKLENFKKKFKKASTSESGKINFYNLIGKIQSLCKKSFFISKEKFFYEKILTKSNFNY